MRLQLLLFFLLGAMLVSCDVSRKIRDGETAFQQKQYAKAVEMLEKEYNKTRTEEFKAYRAYLLGLSYDRMNRSSAAIPWFRKSFQHGYGVDALEQYASLLKEDGKYDLAIKAYETLIQQYGTSPDWEKALEGCRQAQKWVEESENSGYLVEAAEFNSNSADYGPVFLSESQVLFSTDRGNAQEDDTYWWTGRSYSNIFLYDKFEGSSIPYDKNLNSSHNDGALAVNGDRTEIYFTRCNSEDADAAFCRIYLSMKQGEDWTVPVELPFQEDGFNYTSPAVLPNGEGLIFASDIEGGQGKYDLYVVYKRGPNWLEPESMPSFINTEENEAFPGFDGDTLYFSSEGLTGMGGFDIFRTWRRPNGSWTPPVNLKAPINSPADDCCFAVDPWFEKEGDIVKAGMLSSSRANDSGTDDLYYFYQRAGEEEDVPATPSAKPGEMVVKIQVLGKTYNRDGDPNSGILALVPLGDARLMIESTDTTLQPELDENGTYLLSPDPETDYNFVAERRGFLNNSYELSTGSLEEIGEEGITYVVEVVLDPLIRGKEIVLENIYYDFDRWEIRADAEPTLNDLAKLLLLNPDLNIEMGSHTDCRGIEAYNRELSQRRAQSAVDYLVSKGVDRDRLSAKGYGESEPAINCPCYQCTEEEHQRNRRTTFKIL